MEKQQQQQQKQKQKQKQQQQQHVPCSLMIIKTTGQHMTQHIHFINGN
jgi:hypothetical protein